VEQQVTLDVDVSDRVTIAAAVDGGELLRT
jgi:hypothetical protein